MESGVPPKDGEVVKDVGGVVATESNSLNELLVSSDGLEDLEICSTRGLGIIVLTAERVVIKGETRLRYPRSSHFPITLSL